MRGRNFNVFGGAEGTSEPLQDTGKLRQSFTSKLEGQDVVSVGTENKIAKFHQFGTKPYIIKAKTGGALAFMTSNGPVFARSIRHPGLPIRRLIPSDQLANKIAVETLEKFVDKIIEKSQQAAR